MTFLSKYKTVIIIGILLAMIIIGGIFYIYNPEQVNWFPKCWFYQLTGWQCPSCGTQRAFHTLLHGEFTKALAYNPFMILSVPYALIIIASLSFDLPRLKSTLLHRYTLYVYTTLLILWWIIRNL